MSWQAKLNAGCSKRPAGLCAGALRSHSRNRDRFVRFLSLLAVFAASDLLLTAEARAIPAFSQLVVFGDSYSESGNIARGTKAENWVEYMASDLNIPGGLSPSIIWGSNYSLAAATGTGTTTLDLD